MARRLGIVTQDPINRGGVLRLVRYIYERTLAIGGEPIILHYASFRKWPLLSTTLLQPRDVLNPVAGPLLKQPRKAEYQFEGMHAVAIGASFPEWEPRRISPNDLWRSEVGKCHALILVTGSAHTGSVLEQMLEPFAAWVSSTVQDDRRERLRKDNSISGLIEKASLSSILAQERRVLKVASPLIAVSEDARRAILALEPALDVKVWPYPVKTDAFVPGSRLERGKRVLFVGRASDPRKDFPLFIEALIQLRSMDPEIQADVVSAPPNLDVLPRFEIVRGNVRFHAEISDSDLRQLYHAASALLITSQQEGLSIAGLEAMACGLPVVTTRCGGPEMFVRHDVNGFVVERDALAVARAALRLMTEPETRSRCSVEARRTVVEEFSEAKWNRVFEQQLHQMLS